MGTPLMTWGEIDSTPIRLSDTKSQYKMNGLSEREMVAERLAQKMARKKRIAKKINEQNVLKALETLTPHRMSSVRSVSSQN